MKNPQEAIQAIIESLAPLSPEKISIYQAAGRIVAGDVVASTDLPSFDNSAMDGYAIKSSDLKEASRDAPVRLEVIETIRAGGLAKGQLNSGEAVKIMTGATVPSGADAVVKKELTGSVGEQGVLIYRSPKEGDNIRKHGEDVRTGDLVITEKTFLRPYEIAFLASQGITEISVIRKPIMAVIATGDELVEIDKPLSPGMIRNSNGPAVISGLCKWGIQCIDLGIAGDDEGRMEKLLKEALEKSDGVLVSGGVSVGDYDYTRAILQKCGVKEIFWKAAIKPGKPLLFGVFTGQTGETKPVFGLPGNPVAVLVCLEEFVRPAIEKLQGYRPKYPSYHLTGRVLNHYKKPEDRLQYIFCKVLKSDDGHFDIHIIRPQGSAMIGMSCTANALALGPIGVSRINPGDTLRFRWLK